MFPLECFAAYIFQKIELPVANRFSFRFSHKKMPHLCVAIVLKLIADKRVKQVPAALHQVASYRPEIAEDKGSADQRV